MPPNLSSVNFKLRIGFGELTYLIHRCSLRQFGGPDDGKEPDLYCEANLFKATADDIEEFPEDVLALYDRILDEAQTQIKALGNITNIDEKQIRSSVAPEVESEKCAL